MLGAILGAVGSLASGLLGAKSAEKNAAKQAKLQKEFAQNSIQWKAADAEKAGISKLYALGANTTSYSPVSIGDTSGLGNLGPMGQDIGRALDTNAPQSGKASTVLGTAAVKLQLEGMKLDNDIKRTQLASDIAKMGPGITRPGLQDPMMPARVIDGQGDAGFVSDPFKVQKQINAASSHDPTGATEAGVTPDVQFVKTKDGWAPQIPQPLQEAMEDDWLGKAQWNLRNRVYPLMPDMGSYKNQFYNPPFPAPRGKHWQFNVVTGTYQLRSNEQ